MICLKNIDEINDKYGRSVGNTLILKVVNVLKDIMSSDTMHIRYSGVRILSICSNTDADSVHNVVERVLNSIKNEAVYINEERVSVDVQILIHTFKKQNNLEKEVQKMVSYIDGMRDTNTIKII
ncbi:diguanylate cyclase [compost metagenome]